MIYLTTKYKSLPIYWIIKNEWGIYYLPWFGPTTPCNNIIQWWHRHVYFIKIFQENEHCLNINLQKIRLLIIKWNESHFKVSFLFLSPFLFCFTSVDFFFVFRGYFLVYVPDYQCLSFAFCTVSINVYGLIKVYDTYSVLHWPHWMASLKLIVGTKFSIIFQFPVC